MINCGVNQCICDYYVCADKKSEFIYVAIENVEAISLSKDFINEVFLKYPSIAYKIRRDSEHRYMLNIKDVINATREEHIKKINKQSIYKSINLEDKSC